MDRKWTARWIGFAACPNDTSPVFRKQVVLPEVPRTAQVFISGLGAYVLRINGKRVEEDILQPAFSDYNKTVYYNIYEIASYLRSGENTVEVLLGNVWYNEQQETDWLFESAAWKDTPKFIAEFFVDGVCVLRSDDSWDCAESATVFNSLRCGEHYDATKQVVFRQKADVLPAPRGKLMLQTITPIRVSETYAPVQVLNKSVYTGALVKSYVYDFGINLSGNVEIKGTGKRGAKISIRYVERLLENRLPDYFWLNRGFHREREGLMIQTDEYTFCGDGVETWHSEFGYNGFRYVVITGDYEELTVTARCFHTVLPRAGDIECDNPLVMKLHAAVKQSTVTNFHHMPTDCPQREKNGWTGDAHLSAEQAYFNFDMTNAYEKWMHDVADSQTDEGALPAIVPSSDFGYEFDQGPCWDAVLFLIPWQMYRYTGDTAHLRSSYPAMRRYIRYMERELENGLHTHGLADWLALMHEGDLAPDEAVLTLFCGHIAALYRKIALLLGEADDASEAERLHGVIRRAYLEKYGALDINNQTVYALELMFGFTDDRERTVRKLLAAVESTNYHITGGIFCAKYLLDALTDNGYFDVAYRIASQEDFPGWGYLAAVNSGTLGENWCGGQSGNHHMLSEIGAWYYKALAGFRIDEEKPGFRHVFLEPHIPEDIHRFCAYHITPFGKLSLAWDASAVTVEIPEHTTATFRFAGTSRVLPAGRHTIPYKN